MGRAAVWLLAILIVASCGGGNDEASRAGTPSKPALASDGPLSILVVSAAVGPGGEPVDVRPGFTPADKEVNAVVFVGEDVEEGATLDISWYRTGDGRRLLFTHELEAAPIGRARSQGVASTGLAPGAYEVVATLGERQVRTPWLVREAGPTRALAAATSEDDWEPPSAGTASFSETSGNDGPDEGACRIVDFDVYVRVLLSTGVLAHGACTSISVGAAVGGPPQTFFTTPHRQFTVETDLCEIPGGSDLPGAVVLAEVRDSGGASQSEQETLGDLGELLTTTFVSLTPPAGSRVRAGDTIAIEAAAILFQPALGIRTIYVNANDELVEAAGNLSGSQSPRGCDEGRLLAALRTSYRVPPSPPAVIELCTNAVGFDETQATECASYPTRETEVWEGTWDGGFHVPPPCTPSVWEADGTVSFTVAANGTLAGEARITNEPGTCGGTGGPGPTPAGATFTGRRTDDGFELVATLPGVGQRTIPLVRDGSQATGHLSVPLGAGARYDVDLALVCTTC